MIEKKHLTPPYLHSYAQLAAGGWAYNIEEYEECGKSDLTNDSIEFIKLQHDCSLFVMDAIYMEFFYSNKLPIYSSNSIPTKEQSNILAKTAMDVLQNHNNTAMSSKELITRMFWEEDLKLKTINYHSFTIILQQREQFVNIGSRNNGLWLLEETYFAERWRQWPKEGEKELQLRFSISYEYHHNEFVQSILRVLVRHDNKPMPTRELLYRLEFEEEYPVSNKNTGTGLANTLSRIDVFVHDSSSNGTNKWSLESEFYKNKIIPYVYLKAFSKNKVEYNDKYGWQSRFKDHLVSGAIRVLAKNDNEPMLTKDILSGLLSDETIAEAEEINNQTLANILKARKEFVADRSRKWSSWTLTEQCYKSQILA